MKIKVLEPDGSNTGKLKYRVGTHSFSDGASTTSFTRGNDWMEIKKGRYIHQDTSHPLRSDNDLYFKRIYAFESDKKYVYYLSTFGISDSQHGLHIALNRWQHQRFLWMQGKSWFQKEENIRYIVNLIFLIIGVYISLKKFS